MKRIIRIEELPVETQRIYISKRLKELSSKKKEIREEWVRNKKCSCVENLKPGKILICNHVKEQIKKVTDSEREEILEKAEQVLNRELKEHKNLTNGFPTRS